MFDCTSCSKQEEENRAYFEISSGDFHDSLYRFQSSVTADAIWLLKATLSPREVGSPQSFGTTDGTVESPSCVDKNS